MERVRKSSDNVLSDEPGRRRTSRLIRDQNSVSGAGSFGPHVGKIYPADDVTGIPHQISGLNVMGLASDPNILLSPRSPSLASLDENQKLSPNALAEGLGATPSGAKLVAASRVLA